MSRFLQVMIALMGLAITGVLGFASVRNENLQSKHALLSLFSDSITVARTECDPGMLFIAQDAVTGLEELGAGAEYRDRLDEINASVQACAAERATQTQVLAQAPLAEQRADAVRSVQRPEGLAQAPAPAAPPMAIAPELAAQSSNLELRQAEMMQKKAAPSAERGARYFAVLASYAVDGPSTWDAERGAVAHYKQLLQATRGAGVDLRVYRTTTSNHFAIVLVPEGGSRKIAFELIMIARRNGWSPDAYVQTDRDWKQCNEPSSLDGLKGCA